MSSQSAPSPAARLSLPLVLVTALLAGGPGGAAAQASKAADEVVEGAKKIGKRAEGAGKQAKPVADRMHDSAKGFGESIWAGMKSVGRMLDRFFTGK